MHQTLEKIFTAILDGEQAAVTENVPAALEAGLSPETVLKEGLVAAMTEVGRRFEAGEYFVPEMLAAARAMQGGLKLLKPRLVQAGVRAAGKILLGTVAGDMHDIGKTLVGMMLEGAGFEVVDLGTDVKPEAFAEAVREHQPDIVGLSSLLTTTMPGMIFTVQALTEAGLRGQVKVMVGGAPVTAAFAQTIGADGYAPDASAAVKLARSLVGEA
ncbi:MAG: methyltransferase cognate corrinoid protein [Anaerolineaceae bacterium]|nr:MAG: methyltransferase cognate corrinoid protein [Anaerolineaceae bacterium]